MLIHVDCTDVETNIREKTFMPSRDRMRDNEVSKGIENVLAEELSRHEGLRQLNQNRREQQITKNPKDTQFLEGVISKLITKNRDLLSYLGLGGTIKDKTEVGKQTNEEFEGKRIPTYLKIKGVTKNEFLLILFSNNT